MSTIKFAIAFICDKIIREEEISMGIGERIRVLCARKGLSIRQLAIKAGVPYTTLYSAVRRNSDSMDTEALKKVASALGIDPIRLVIDEDELHQTATEWLLSLSPEQLRAHEEDYAKTKRANLKLDIFRSAAELSGFSIDWDKEPIVISKSSSGEKIAENVSYNEFVESVNELIKYAGLLCMKMSDSYKHWINTKDEGNAEG